MGRPKEYDEQHVLHQALLTFWRLGYEHCSIRDLLDATGLKRQSLYNAFGDKRGLFLEVLARYNERIVADLRPLQTSKADLSSLAAYMGGAVESQRQMGPGACLLVITAFSPSSDDAEIAAAIERGACLVREAFASVIERQIDAGTLRPETDPIATAAFLFSVLNGLGALQRTGGGNAGTTTSVITQALQSLSAG